MAVDAILFLRFAYLAASLLIVCVFALPPLRSRFLQYGARSIALKANGKIRHEQNHSGTYNVLAVVLDRAASIRVPHSWFTSFYAISVLCSLFWAPELIVKGPTLRTISHACAFHQHSMTYRQVMTTWLMMLAQGSRRLYECMVLSKPSSSQMWVGHWVMGIFFYLATGIAIWIEGIRKLNQPVRLSMAADNDSASIEKHSFSLSDLLIEGPGGRTFLGVLMFILASGLQHDCHAYLASLKESKSAGARTSEYKFPEHPAFNISLNPHYLAECLIYLSLAVVAAPHGDWLNWTLVSSLVFVVVNLGITAHGTKLWYESKFGAELVNGKARMIPLLY